MAARGLILLAALGVLVSATRVHALADTYQVDFIEQPGATSTSIRGVDEAGRVLGYWSYFSQPTPLPIGAEPDDEGYFLWESGTLSPLTIPGLSGVNISRMNATGDIWGSSDQGGFVYRNGVVSVLQSSDSDVTVVQGVDAMGRSYGLLANYAPDSNPNDTLVPLEPVSSFVWENGSFSNLDLMLDGAILHGVRRDGLLWGSNASQSFLQMGQVLTLIDHPGYDYTGLFMVTAEDDAFGFGLTATETLFETTDFFWNATSGFQDWPDAETLPGTQLRPNEMNQDGVFWGYSTSGAFVATPVPEPGTGLLMALALVLVLVATMPPGGRAASGLAMHPRDFR